MAQSPTHKFGQIVGHLLEEMLHEPLHAIARKHRLYLDFKHERPARNDRKKVTWVDHKGNKHDLDYVLEQGGSEESVGIPKAFIECAWRRYTKHSRNKAQEIHGAVAVLAETYAVHRPFLGVVLAGVFTEGSLKQLKSHDFSVIYCSYENVIRAFAKVGIDASFDESTPDADVQEKVSQFDALTPAKRKSLLNTLRKMIRDDLDGFMKMLERSLTRSIERIRVTTLHGSTCEVSHPAEAAHFIECYDESTSLGGFVRYEVDIQYSNGDRITGQFEQRLLAIEFLNGQAQ